MVLKLKQSLLWTGAWSSLDSNHGSQGELT